jgi:hypothetical protein
MRAYDPTTPQGWKHLTKLYTWGVKTFRTFWAVEGFLRSKNYPRTRFVSGQRSHL